MEEGLAEGRRSELERLLLAYMLVFPTMTVKRLASLLRGRRGGGTRYLKREMEAALEGLHREGWLQKREGRTPWYWLVKTFPRSVYRGLLDEAFPNRRPAWLAVEFSVFSGTVAWLDQSRLYALFALCYDDEAYLDAARKAALDLRAVMGSLPAILGKTAKELGLSIEADCPRLSGRFGVVAGLADLADLFWEGRPLAGRLAGLVERAQGGRPFLNDEAVCAVGALCVWTGRRDLLACWRAAARAPELAAAAAAGRAAAEAAAAGKSLSKKAAAALAAEGAPALKSGTISFLEGCEAVFDQDWDMAGRKTASCPFRAGECDWPKLMPAYGLLSVLATLRGRPVLSRLAQWAKAFRELAGVGRGDIGLRDGQTALARQVDAVQEMCREGRPKNLFDDKATAAVVAAGAGPAFLLLPLPAYAARGMEEGEEGAPGAGRLGELMRAAEQAVQRGYPTLGMILAGCFAWHPAAAEAARGVLEKARAAGGAAFWIAERPVERWRRALRDLEAAFGEGAAGAAGGADGGGGRPGSVFYWEIMLETAGDSVFTLQGFGPLLRKVYADGHLSSGRHIGVDALFSSENEKLMTEEDRKIFAVVSAMSGRSYYWSFASFLCSPDLLAAFCGHPRLLFLIDGGRGVHARLEKRQMPVKVTGGKGGGVRIGVRQPPPPGEGQELQVTRVDLETFCFYVADDHMRRLAEVIGKYGSGGELAVPKEGMAELAPLMKRISEKMPIQGALGEDAGAMLFERVAGRAALQMRVVFREDVLDLTLRAAPVEGVDLLVEAGVGARERTIRLGGKTVVLERDLEAERAAAEEVAEAMGPWESWARGNGIWRIESIESALGALSALRGLEGRVELVWPEGDRIKLTSAKASDLNLSASEGVERWFSLKGEFRLEGGKVLSFMSVLDRLEERKGRFVPLGGSEYLELTDAMLKRMEALRAAGAPGRDGLDICPAAVPMLCEAFRGADKSWALPGLLDGRMRDFRKALAAEVRVPGRLKCALRPYQEEGYAWLSRLAACGIGSCLADDMGLGKTVEVLALLLARAGDGPSIVVAPASVCGNWLQEIGRFTPTLNALMAGRLEDDAGAVAAAGPHDVVVCSYGLLVARESAFTSRSWNGAVLDEAQAVKNAQSKRAHAVKNIRAAFRVVATGTPVENRLLELWSLFDFLNPGIFGSQASFMKKYTAGGKARPALKRLVAPLILRRVKRDVLDDLPEKTEITLPVLLGDEERHAYEGCRIRALESLTGERGGNRICILAELTKIRRFCCCPSLVIPGFRECAKMDALVGLLGELRENSHRALIFSQFVDFLTLVRGQLDSRGWSYKYLDGATPTKERGALVDAFQRGEGDFFVISLKAGGLGLNLTAANYVILLDPWWNPAVENQAADRVYRIGQRRAVTIYRLIAKDTVEERVVELHKKKQDLANDVLEGTGDTSLTPEMLMGLLAEGGGGK